MQTGSRSKLKLRILLPGRRSNTQVRRLNPALTSAEPPQLHFTRPRVAFVPIVTALSLVPQSKSSKRRRASGDIPQQHGFGFMTSICMIREDPHVDMGVFKPLHYR